MRRARTQEDIDTELVRILSSHLESPEDAINSRLYDIRMEEMKRSGMVADEQRVIIRVWRHGQTWVAPVSIGPALVPFTDISTKDLGRSEMREILGGVPEETIPGPGGSVLMKRGPLTAAIVQVPDEMEPDELARMVSDLRGQYDTHINAA